MSWFATKYAWRCSHLDASGDEVIKGSTKLFLLAIAWRVPSGCFETEPTSLGEFEELTGIQSRQLRECRTRLMTVGEVLQRGGGKLAVYEMPRLKGPLFAVENPAKIAGISGRNPAKIADENRQRLPGRAVGVLSSGSTSTNSTSTTKEAAAEAFLDWFLRAYQQHRGVLYRIPNPAKAEQAVRELLAARSVERVQAMAVAMFGDTADEWLNDPNRRNDRGIFSLLHKSTYLEELVVARERRRRADDEDVPYVERIGYCRHTPRCEKAGGEACRALDALIAREATA